MSIWPEKHISEGRPCFKFYNLEQVLDMVLKIYTNVVKS